MAVTPNGVLYIAGINSSGTGYLISKSTDAQNPAHIPPNFTTTSVNLGGQIASFGGPNPGDGIGLVGGVAEIRSVPLPLEGPCMVLM